MIKIKSNAGFMSFIGGVIAALIVVGGIVAFRSNKQEVSVETKKETIQSPSQKIDTNIKSPDSSLTSRIKIALLDPSHQSKGKVVGCDTAVLVERAITPTATPLTISLKELFSGKDAWNPSGSGLGNFLTSQKDLKFEKVTIENTIAKVYLIGKIGPLSGVCDDPRIISQITETALQFETVKAVLIYLNGLKWDGVSQK